MTTIHYTVFKCGTKNVADGILIAEISNMVLGQIDIDEDAEILFSFLNNHISDEVVKALHIKLTEKISGDGNGS